MHHNSKIFFAVWGHNSFVPVGKMNDEYDISKMLHFYLQEWITLAKMCLKNNIS